MAKRISWIGADACLSCAGPIEPDQEQGHTCRRCWDVITRTPGQAFMRISQFEAMPIGASVVAAPPVDPLAGVDWSQYLPRDGCICIPCRSVIPGDVIGWVSLPIRNQRAVLRVGEPTQWGHEITVLACNGPVIDIGPYLTALTAGEFGLIAHEGKFAPMLQPGLIKPAAAKPAVTKPAPRAHDFSNPYLHRPAAGSRLCVGCGEHQGPYLLEGCRPVEGWRDQLEKTFAARMLARDVGDRCQREHSPPAAPYRNDVAGIGARLGGYHNVAPERGR